jgi:hypothetical protein
MTKRQLPQRIPVSAPPNTSPFIQHLHRSFSSLNDEQLNDSDGLRSLFEAHLVQAQQQRRQQQSTVSEYRIGHHSKTIGNDDKEILSAPPAFPINISSEITAAPGTGDAPSSSSSMSTLDLDPLVQESTGTVHQTNIAASMLVPCASVAAVPLPCSHQEVSQSLQRFESLYEQAVAAEKNSPVYLQLLMQAHKAADDCIARASNDAILNHSELMAQIAKKNEERISCIYTVQTKLQGLMDIGSFDSRQ